MECCCRRFDAAAFGAELKEVLRAAGVEGTPLLLFLEERHLADDPGEQTHLLLAIQVPAACCVVAACWQNDVLTAVTFRYHAFSLLLLLIGVATSYAVLHLCWSCYDACVQRLSSTSVTLNSVILVDQMLLAGPGLLPCRCAGVPAISLPSARHA
jgi:hypothetical protein